VAGGSKWLLLIYSWCLQRGMKLSEAEMIFFKREGYLIKRGAMPSELCTVARDRLWKESGSAVLRREDPASWVGPLPEVDLSADGQNYRGPYRWQWRAGGGEEIMLDLLPRACKGMAEQLLGVGTLRDVGTTAAMAAAEAATPVLAGKLPRAEIGTRCRGIYCTLPYGVARAKTRNEQACHTDGHPMSLGMVGLIDKVKPGGGAFAVWPRSHRRFFHKFKWQYSCRDELGNNDFTERYTAELERVKVDTVPVDCYGDAGDVVFWHHRLAHMAGQNYSQLIRQTILYDYIKLPQFYDDGPPPAEMWRDWSPEMRALPLHIVRGPQHGGGRGGNGGDSGFHDVLARL
jgi:hypothetical protein